MSSISDQLRSLVSLRCQEWLWISRHRRHASASGGMLRSECKIWVSDWRYASLRQAHKFWLGSVLLTQIVAANCIAIRAICSVKVLTRATYTWRRPTLERVTSVWKTGPGYCWPFPRVLILAITVGSLSQVHLFYTWELDASSLWRRIWRHHHTLSAWVLCSRWHDGILTYQVFRTVSVASLFAVSVRL